jgi:hypothetical protein
MGDNNVKEASASPRTGAVSPQKQAQPHNGPNFEAIVLGQTVGPLVLHAVATTESAPPSHPVSSTITQPQSLRERSGGQTRKLFGSEPMPQQEKHLELGNVKEVQAFGYVASGCTIHNLHPKSPLVEALCIHLGRHAEKNDLIEVTKDVIADNAVQVIGAVSAYGFLRKIKLSEFCSFVKKMRGYEIDDECIAFLITNGVKCSPWVEKWNIVMHLDTAGIHKLIANCFHEMASFLLRDIETVKRSLPSLIFENLYKKCTQQGIDPQALGIAPKFAADRHFTNLKALFCTDLCTGPELDPVQAARIVVAHLTETGEPLPYQQAVMECLCTMIETPDEAKRVVHALVRIGAPASPPVQAWMAPLLEMASSDAFVDAALKI